MLRKPATTSITENCARWVIFFT
uniref:Uncharacterized protein n=1 Tax=Anguilla anguilla TaxID=7936 RepID=A0A0E9UFK5_ANGAN